MICTLVQTVSTPRPPLVLVHGFTDTPRTWDAVVPLLESRFELYLPTLLGHHGGDAIPAQMPSPLRAMADALEGFMDAQQLDRAHIAGNSLGGLLTLALADRGRALSGTALAPSGGWEEQRVGAAITRRFKLAHRLAPVGAPRAEKLAARPRLRKLAFRDVAAHGERIAPATAAALLRGAADCAMFTPLLGARSTGEYRLDRGRSGYL